MVEVVVERVLDIGVSRSGSGVLVPIGLVDSRGVSVLLLRNVGNEFFIREQIIVSSRVGNSMLVVSGGPVDTVSKMVLGFTSFTVALSKILIDKDLHVELDWVGSKHELSGEVDNLGSGESSGAFIGHFKFSVFRDGGLAEEDRAGVRNF